MTQVRFVIPFLLLSQILWAAGYKGIAVGQRVSDLPKELQGEFLFRGGIYDGTFFRVLQFEGKVTTVNIYYQSPGVSDVTISSSVPLFQAVRIHSLAGSTQPHFSLAAVGDDVYGVIDTSNAIVYHFQGALSVNSLVTQVSYLEASAPAVVSAKSMRQDFETSLLDSARKASSFAPRVQIVNRSGYVRAASRADALKALQEQRDVVLGKIRRTSALIRSVSTWYEVDKDHPKALKEADELRKFMVEWAGSVKKMDEIYKANQDLLKKEDVLLTVEITEKGERLLSEYRQLKAMGFEE